MNRRFLQPFHGETVQAAMVFGSTKDALYGGTFGVEGIGGDLHLMTRVGLNNRNSMITLNNFAIGGGTITSVRKDVSWWRGQTFQGWSDLMHVGFVGRGDIGTERDFVGGVTDEVEFVAVPPHHSSVGTLLPAGLRVGISSLVGRIGFDVAGIDSHNVANIRHQFAQVRRNDGHDSRHDVSVFELGDKAADGVLGGSAANGVSDSRIIGNKSQTSGDRRGIQDERGEVGHYGREETTRS